MAQSSKRDPDEDPVSWHRSTAAVSLAGVAGIVVVGALVVTVVQYSDQWSSPPTPTVVTTSAPTTAQTLRTTEPFIATPTYGSSTFSTSVRLSTTDIGVPGEVTSTTGSSESESSPSSTRATRTPRTTQGDDDDQTTTTRKRPRLNETRTLSP